MKKCDLTTTSEGVSDVIARSRSVLEDSDVSDAVITPTKLELFSSQRAGFSVSALSPPAAGSYSVRCAPPPLSSDCVVFFSAVPAAL